jgi:hypothetical protein
MKKYIFFALALLGTQEGFAQLVSYHYEDEKHIYANSSSREINYFPDSIRIELPDRNILLVLEAKNFKVAQEVLSGLKENLTSLVEVIEKSHVHDASAIAHRVDVTKDLNNFSSIQITEVSSPSTHVMVKEKQVVQLLPPAWEVYQADVDYKLYIYTNKIESLGMIETQELESVKTKLVSSRTFTVGRNSVKSRFILRNGSVEYQDIKYYHPLDMLSLSLSAAAGVIRSKVYPEIAANLGVWFADRFNRYNHRIEFSYSALYFAERLTEGAYASNISSFGSLSYCKNFSKKGTHPGWVGLGAGLLLDQRGNFHFFKGKTMKFFLVTESGSSKLSVIPELYLTEGYKKTVFGLKANYRF